MKQLVFYHRVLTTHKIVQTKAPMYLHQKMITSHPYQTRQATDGFIRFGEQCDARRELTRSGFCYKGTQDYNLIPAEIRASRTVQTFKYKLKKWVENNIPLD